MILVKIFVTESSKSLVDLGRRHATTSTLALQLIYILASFKTTKIDQIARKTKNNTTQCMSKEACKSLIVNISLACGDLCQRQCFSVLLCL